MICWALENCDQIKVSSPESLADEIGQILNNAYGHSRL